MAIKTTLSVCNCIHCKKKSEQINNSRSYWRRLILRKDLA